MDYLISIADQLTPHLRSMRKFRQLSQKDLALKMGVSQSRIAAIERNPHAVSAGQLIAILHALEVDIVLRDQRKRVPISSDPSNNNNDTGSDW